MTDANEALRALDEARHKFDLCGASFEYEIIRAHLTDPGYVRVPVRMVEWIARNKPSLPDYACAECVPHSDMLLDGFKCAYHTAIALLAATKETSHD